MSASPDIFLSYNREDVEVARRFAEGFEAQGFDVWWDQALRSGEAYDEVTEAALRSAKAVVVLWSPRSVVSRWVRAEATLADRNRTLIPARIEPCDLPIMFELTQTAELTQWRGDSVDPVWRSFLGDVMRMVGVGDEVADTTTGSAHSSLRTAQGRTASIAVLPFINRSGVPEDDIFADGMVDDLTTALTISRRMKVIAASATAAYRTGARDIKQIGRELGVRYLLEGNVRRVGSNLRVTAQLVEAEDGDIFWTQKFDRPLSELALLQEDLVSEVAAHLGVQVDRAEMEQALRKPGDITAWEAILRALAYLGQPTMVNVEAAIVEASRAVEIDPDYDHGHAVLALALGLLFNLRDRDDPQLAQSVKSSIGRAQASVSVDPLVLARIAAALTFIAKPEDALPYAQRAISINPNLEIPRIALGTALHKLGRLDEAINELEVAERLAPNGPWTGATLFFRSMAHLCAGRYVLGLQFAERALTMVDTDPSHLAKILCQAGMGSTSEACATLRLLRAKRRGLTREFAEALVRDPICAGAAPEVLERNLELFRCVWDETEGEA